MGLEFFKANKSVKGVLASISFNSKDGALYLKLVRQTSYNEARHIGGFKDGLTLNVKFNASELGGFLRSLRERVEVKFFHSMPDSKTSITFGPYNAKDNNEVAGFGLSVFKGDDKYRVPFTLDEAHLLEEYFEYVLTHFFDAIYAEDKRRAAEYAAKKGQTENKTSTALTKKYPDPANDAGFGDDNPASTSQGGDDDIPF